MNPRPRDFYISERWCQALDAELVSINDPKENDFVHRICHNDPDPITYPKETTHTECWIGLHEKAGTGSVRTPQLQQKWRWSDGSVVDAYANWAKVSPDPDLIEPNNQKTKQSMGMDVRHAMMNQDDDKRGFWFDGPAQTRANAVCEKDPMKKKKKKKEEKKKKKAVKTKLK